MTYKWVLAALEFFLLFKVAKGLGWNGEEAMGQAHSSIIRRCYAAVTYDRNLYKANPFLDYSRQDLLAAYKRIKKFC